MGYRSEQKWEDAELARYRAEVPRRVRVWYAILGWANLVGSGIAGVAIVWWLTAR